MQQEDFETRVARMRQRLARRGDDPLAPRDIDPRALPDADPRALHDIDPRALHDIDPRALHDDLRRLVDDMAAARQRAPCDLREALETLEADILEDFYDNLPV